MMIRTPAFAGRFYAGSPDKCLADIKTCIQRAAEPAPHCDPCRGDESIIGGVVPHAGWAYSGAVAARVLNEIARREHPQAIVIFGAIHVLHGASPTLFSTGVWETPIGDVAVDDRLSRRLLGQTTLLEEDPHAHEKEHSIEVELPFLRHLLPETQIVPIMVPVNGRAEALGSSVGHACRNYGVRATFLCSTDLTHYGPSFGFTPQGEGEQGVDWASTVNDRRMIDLMLEMRAGDAVEESVKHRNACGGGAIAATIAACKSYGATRAALLEHTTSYEVGRKQLSETARDSVGYAGIIFG